MKHTTQLSFVILLAAIVLTNAVSLQADVIIDPFNGYQTLSASGTPAGPKNAFASLTDPIVLGGERDVWLSRTSSNSGSVSMDVDGSFNGALAYASSPATSGYALITYDGTDGSSALNYTGLGGIDLTQSGVNTGVAIGTTSDIGAAATFTVYSDATHYSTYNVPVLADIDFNFTRYFATFSSFTTGAGAAGGADFTNVGAITLKLDGTANPGTDIGVDYFVATVPEPSGSMLILSAGLVFILRRPHASRRA